MKATTPQQFRASVESRLSAESSATGRSINRVRTLLVMERFLTRMVAVAPDAFVLKGGLALELRLPRARTTRDVDVLARGDGDSAEALMRRVAALVPDPPDHIEFAVGPNPIAQEIDGAGVRYRGRRFQVTPTIASRPFGDRFGVDVAVADAVVGAPDMLEGSDFFGRYGLTRLCVPAYPLPTHLAEKLHALTLPRSQPSSRLKDLVDVALLSELDGHNADLLRTAIDRTFTFRASHLVPSQMPEPPGEWTAKYARMQRDERLVWATLDDLMRAARAFLDPVLAGAAGRWDTSSCSWRA
jgi:hypothetical protein